METRIEGHDKRKERETERTEGWKIKVQTEIKWRGRKERKQERMKRISRVRPLYEFSCRMSFILRSSWFSPVSSQIYVVLYPVRTPVMLLCVPTEAFCCFSSVSPCYHLLHTSSIGATVHAQYTSRNFWLCNCFHLQYGQLSLQQFQKYQPEDLFNDTWKQKAGGEKVVLKIILSIQPKPTMTSKNRPFLGYVGYF
jgi:hypothetical protein